MRSVSSPRRNYGWSYERFLSRLSFPRRFFSLSALLPPAPSSPVSSSRCSRYTPALRGRISRTVRSHVKDETPGRSRQRDEVSRQEAACEFFRLRWITSDSKSGRRAARKTRELLGTDGQIVRANCNNSTRRCIRGHYVFIATKWAGVGGESDWILKQLLRTKFCGE